MKLVDIQLSQIDCFSYKLWLLQKMLHEIVGDVTECPICAEVIVDSKVLPCIHTFCLKCLKGFLERQNTRRSSSMSSLQDAIQYSRRRIV